MGSAQGTEVDMMFQSVVAKQIGGFPKVSSLKVMTDRRMDGWEGAIDG